MQRTVATLGTSAISDGSQVAFSVRGIDFRFGNPVIGVEGLASSENVYLWKLVNGDWEEVSPDAGDTQTTFTPSYAADVVNGPGTYGFTKDVTAGTITITIDNGR